MSILRNNLQRTDCCIVCKQQAYLIDDGWYTDTCIKIDDEGDYLAGDGSLVDADDTPMGWVCSQSCLSQAMYNACDEWEKEVLNKVLDAQHIISEYDEQANRIIYDRMGMDYDTADEFLSLVEAPWTNRQPLEGK
jgi:hypothetical protein